VPAVGRENDAVNIVVLRADERQFGLIVDDVNDTEEIVVKPLGKQLKGINTFAGATIMGDGQVALILDPVALGRRANIVSDQRARSALAVHALRDSDASKPDFEVLLLVQSGANQMVLPLAHVTRLEEFRADSVELAGLQEVIQYRGKIMPLIRLSEVLYQAQRRAPGDKTLQAVVYNDGEVSAGLVVDEILDIVEETLVIEPMASPPGIRGSAVIQKRVVDVLDVQAAVRLANPQWFTLRPAALAKTHWRRTPGSCVRFFSKGAHLPCL
jgi:two-component system chemotaxis sensor kinase CheA